MFETRIEIKGREVVINTFSYKEALLVYEGAKPFLTSWTRHNAVKGTVRHAGSLYDLYNEGAVIIGEILNPIQEEVSPSQSVHFPKTITPPKGFNTSEGFATIMKAIQHFPVLLPGIIASTIQSFIYKDGRNKEKTGEWDLKETKETITYLRSLLKLQPNGSAQWEMIRDILGGTLRPYEDL